MATPKISTYEDVAADIAARQDDEEILIQRVINVATIHPSKDYGAKPMVVAAFAAAAEYIDFKMSQGMEEELDVQFSYKGITFHATAGM